MATLKSRWLEWRPPTAGTSAGDADPSPEPNMRGKGTDKTDKSPSVSFVSSFPGHIDAGSDRTDTGSWCAQDWTYHYEERAAIVEHDGELPRHAAERMALADTINHWLVQHPPEPTDGGSGCVHCGADLGEDGVPVLAGGGHTWLHSACHQPWLADRRRLAAEALRILGIFAPSDLRHDIR